MTALTPRTIPFGSSSLIRRLAGLDSLVDDFMNDPFFTKTLGPATIPHLNMWETEEGVSIEMMVPGLTKENVKVTAQGRTVTVTGHKEITEEVPEYQTFEHNYSKFVRQVTLPRGANTKNIKATVVNGMLTIEVPVEGERNDVVDIEIA